MKNSKNLNDVVEHNYEIFYFNRKHKVQVLYLFKGYEDDALMIADDNLDDYKYYYVYEDGEFIFADYIIEVDDKKALESIRRFRLLKEAILVVKHQNVFNYYLVVDRPQKI